MRNEKLKTSDKVLMQKVADEAVLLDLDSQSYFGLDPVGTLIWKRSRTGIAKQRSLNGLFRNSISMPKSRSGIYRPF